MEKDYLIKKWLNNNLTEAETKAFDALEDAALYKKIIDEAQNFKGEHQAKVIPFAALDTVLEQKKARSLNWKTITLQIAAALLIGIAVFTLLSRDKLNTFNTDVAQNEIITLPDNSNVTLNELSELEFNASKWDKKRTLNLKGEAFFDVEKGKRFDVNTAFGKVSVLGTEFNVISRDSLFKVSCYEGLVQVSYNSETIKLPAGTEFILKSGKANTTQIAVVEPYWLKNMSVFENSSITSVFAEIEKQFHISIQNDFEENDTKFTGAFEHNNLENALKSVTQPLNLTYEIINTKAVIIRHVKE